MWVDLEVFHMRISGDRRLLNNLKIKISMQYMTGQPSEVTFQ